MEKALDTILSVRDLKKSFPGFQMEGITFELPRGYIMGFIGPNGAGKTTTIKIILDLVRKDGGEIRICGKDHRVHQIRDKIGFVFDESYFYEDLTVESMKNIITAFYRNWDETAFQKYVRLFKLPPAKKIKVLSRGTKTKFALAIALSHGAELLIMDEPTAGLDPVFRQELLGILSDLIQDERKAVLFSTHMTSDLEKAADYICFISEGRQVFVDSIDRILNEFVLVKGSRDSLTRERESLFLGVRRHAFGFEALSREVQAVRDSFGDQVLLEKASLEDIMLFTVRGRENCSI